MILSHVICGKILRLFVRGSLWCSGLFHGVQPFFYIFGRKKLPINFSKNFYWCLDIPYNFYWPVKFSVLRCLRMLHRDSRYEIWKPNCAQNSEVFSLFNNGNNQYIFFEWKTRVSTLSNKLLFVHHEKSTIDYFYWFYLILDYTLYDLKVAFFLA